MRRFWYLISTRFFLKTPFSAQILLEFSVRLRECFRIKLAKAVFLFWDLYAVVDVSTVAS
jgi:hypothetical protein